MSENKKSSSNSKVFRGAKLFVRSAAHSTKRLTRIAKLNMDIARQKDIIKHVYTDIGRLYFEAHRDEPEGFFVHYFQTIDAALESIAVMEAEVAALKAETVPAKQASSAEDADITVEIEVEPDTDEESVPAEESAPAGDTPEDNAPETDAETTF